MVEVIALHGCTYIIHFSLLLPPFHDTEKDKVGTLMQRLLVPLYSGGFARGPHRFEVVVAYLEAVVQFSRQRLVSIGRHYHLLPNAVVLSSLCELGILLM